MALTESFKKVVFIAGALVLAGLLIWQLPFFARGEEQPPEFRITSSTYQGFLKKGGLAIFEEADKTAHENFKKNFADSSPISEKLDFYYVEKDTLLSDIIKGIGPSAEKFMFAYYSPGEPGLSKGFHVYPIAPSVAPDVKDKAYAIENPANFTIKKGRGFILYSHKTSVAYGFARGNKQPVSALHYLPPDELSGWVLIASQQKNYAQIIAGYENRIQNAYLQAPNGTFQKITSPTTTLESSYMLWLNIKPKVAVTPDPTLEPTPAAIPGKVTTLKATSSACGTITVTWKAPTENPGAVVAYKIGYMNMQETATPKKEFISLATELKKTTDGSYIYALTGLKNSTYAIEVRAYNGTEFGAVDAMVNVNSCNSPDPEAPVTLPPAPILTAADLTLSWKAYTQPILAYQVSCKSDQNKTYSYLIEDQMFQSTPKTVTIAGSAVTLLKSISSGANLTSYHVALNAIADIPGTYQCSVSAKNTKGFGEAAFATLVVKKDTPAPDPTPAAIPGKVTALSADSPECGTITVTWKAPTENAASVVAYQILYIDMLEAASAETQKKGVMAPVTQLKKTADGSYTYTFKSLKNSTYAIEVRGYTGTDFGEVHAVVNVNSCGSTASSLVSPANLTISQSGAHSIMAGWNDANSGASYFELKYFYTSDAKFDPFGQYPSKTVTLPYAETEEKDGYFDYMISNVQADSTYLIQVRTCASNTQCSTWAISSPLKVVKGESLTHVKNLSGALDTAISGVVVLSWDTPVASQKVTDYKIYYRDVNLKDTTSFKQVSDSQIKLPLHGKDGKTKIGVQLSEGTWAFKVMPVNTFGETPTGGLAAAEITIVNVGNSSAKATTPSSPLNFNVKNTDGTVSGPQFTYSWDKSANEVGDKIFNYHLVIAIYMPDGKTSETELTQGMQVCDIGLKENLRDVVEVDFTGGKDSYQYIFDKGEFWDSVGSKGVAFVSCVYAQNMVGNSQPVKKSHT